MLEDILTFCIAFAAFMAGYVVPLPKRKGKK
jgi:hypothetical protein